MKGKGFTLVEVVFSVAVGMVLMGAAYVAMISGQQSSAGVEKKVSALQDVRGALQTMSLELSAASYNPNYVSGIWHDLPPNPGDTVQCTGSGNQTNKGIREATPTSITIEMDVGESGMVGDQPGEIVRYNYEGNLSAGDKQYISREADLCNSSRAGTASPFLGADPASNIPRTVRVINNNLEDSSRNIVNGHQNMAVFRYYDSRIDSLNPLGNELYPDEDSSVIPNIRRIDITLAVETEDVDPSTKARKQMTYTTSVAVRNHALSW